jgi:hypothetical protein
MTPTTGNRYHTGYWWALPITINIIRMNDIANSSVVVLESLEVPRSVMGQNFASYDSMRDLAP